MGTGRGHPDRGKLRVRRRPCLVCGTPSTTVPSTSCLLADTRTPSPSDRHSPRNACAGCAAEHRLATTRSSGDTSSPAVSADLTRVRTCTRCTRAATSSSARGQGGGCRTPFDETARLTAHLNARKSRPVVLVAADFSADAEVRYADVVARRDAIRAAWQAEGEPLLATGSTGQLVEHPLVKMLREHDLLCDRLGASVRRRHSGPAPSAVLTPTIGQSPASKLRAVK